MSMENSALVASNRERYADELRRWCVSDTLSLLVQGLPYDATLRITLSVLGEQARAAGIRVDGAA